MEGGGGQVKSRDSVQQKDTNIISKAPRLRPLPDLESFMAVRPVSSTYIQTVHLVLDVFPRQDNETHVRSVKQRQRRQSPSL